MSGLSDLIDLELPPSLDVVGRIRPEQVWDYVNQTRRVGTRDVVVFRMALAASADAAERKTYATYLSNMHKSNRFAVVGNVSKLIKDFYIVPLPKDSPVPVALKVLSLNMKGMSGRVQFHSVRMLIMSLLSIALDENRTSQLLGVVVRTKRKRPGADSSGSGSSKPAKVAKTSSKTITPPTSSTSSPSINYIPTARNATKQKTEPAKVDTTATDDAPYSPGQLLNDDDIDETNDVLKQKEMLEELNRKIEEQKQELAVMSAEVVSKVGLTDESSVLIPGLGEPVIPGLGGPSEIVSSNSWNSAKDTRVTPATDPPFEHSSTTPATAPLDLNLSNLQVITFKSFIVI